MGNCCASSLPTCTLGRTELDNIDAMARDVISKMPQLPAACIYVAKIMSSRGMQYNQLLTKVKVDITPVVQYDPAPGEPPQKMQILDSTSKMMGAAIFETTNQAMATMLTAAVNSTQGGKSPDQTKTAAQRALQSASQGAVFRIIEEIMLSQRGAIISVPKVATAAQNANQRAGGPTSPGRGIPPPSTSAQQQPPPGAAAYHVPTSSLNPAHLSQSGENQFHHQQQQHSHMAPASPGHNPHAAAGAGAGAEDEWGRYPVPQENGPWVKVNEAFYWSESAQLYFFPAAGHFFHPDSGMWHDPEQPDQWMDEEQHEALLERMAQQGLY